MLHAPARALPAAIGHPLCCIAGWSSDRRFAWELHASLITFLLEPGPGPETAAICGFVQPPIAPVSIEVPNANPDHEGLVR